MSHGAEISKSQAQVRISQHLKIVGSNRQRVSDFLKLKGDNEGANYYFGDSGGRPCNCFIFDRNLIENFFNNGATQLLVFLGADPGTDGIVTATDDPSAGQPTVIIFGCTSQMSTGGIEIFNSLPGLTNPAVEHPPLCYIPLTPDNPFAGTLSNFKDVCDLAIKANEPDTLTFIPDTK